MHIMLTDMEIPFIYGKIADGVNFTDRETDQERLYLNFSGLVNTVLIAPRRWGKSSLVNRVVEKFADDKSIIICQLDIFNCRNEEQFYKSFAQSVLKASSSKFEEFIANVRKYLGKLMPTISLSDVAQTYELSFGVEFKGNGMSYDDILELPDKICRETGKKMIVCIDEFQNIGNYDDPLAFQQKLRSHWQRHTKTCYCLYGSKRHMLLDIFNSYNMPFYKFGDILFLDKIERGKWVDFILSRFSDSGKRITPEAAGMIADLVKCHPYYTQQLSQQVWLRTENTADETLVFSSFLDIVGQLSLLFANLTDTLTERQINFLTAVSDGVRNFSSAEILAKYNLGTSANIKNLRKAVLEKDLVDIFPDNHIEFQDPLFEYWLKNQRG